VTGVRRVLPLLVATDGERGVVISVMVALCMVAIVALCGSGYRGVVWDIVTLCVG
jgi:hypothetical protein